MTAYEEIIVISVILAILIGITIMLVITWTR